MVPFRDPLTTLQDHAAFVRAVARRLVADPSDVDDLVQETWLRALTHGRAPRSIRAWLARVVRSAWIDRHRAERARRRREQMVAAQRAYENPTEGAGDDAFGFASLTRALEALPAEYRRVLQLRYHADLSPTSIAAGLGVPLPTVKARLARALHLLRADLDSRHGHGRWPGLLIPLLPQPPGAAPAASLTVVTGVFVNKLLVVAAAGVVLALLLPCFLEPPPGVAPVPSADTAAAATAMVAAPAEAASPPTQSAAAPLAREVATPAALAVGERVRCRVQYHSTGQGVPWLPVRLRDGQRNSLLTTDGDGVFETVDCWPTSVEIAVEGAPTPADVSTTLAAETAIPVLRATHLIRADEVTAATTAVSATSTHGRGDATVRFQPLATAAVRDGDGWRMVVELGPTYLLRIDPAGHCGSLRAFLRNADDANGTRAERSSSSLPMLLASPRADAPWWCRLPPAPDWFGEHCRLVVVSEDGFWRGERAEQPHAGVVGPLAVELRGQGHVRGRVRDAFGMPLANKLVVATIGEEAVALRFSARTGDDGSFRLTCVPPGDGHVGVAGEEFEPHSASLQVRAREVTTCDLAVRQRAKGGRIAGTIATASGAKFPFVSVYLTSRRDGSIWRTANIDWSEVEGRDEASFAFDDVPLVECEVTLNTFAPCRVRARRQTLTPPQERVRFDLDDRVSERELSVVVRRSDGEPCPNWTLRLVGDDGWTCSFDAADAAKPIRVPDLPATWHLLAPDLRTRNGRLEALVGGRLELRGEAGWSAMLVAMEFPNFFPVRGSVVFADDAPVGTLDENGELLLDLPRAPQRLTVDPARWRVYRDAAHRSDVDEHGVLLPRSAKDPQVSLYLQRVP